MDGERRGEEESAPDSQDLSSAASLDRGKYLEMVTKEEIHIHFKTRFRIEQ